MLIKNKGNENTHEAGRELTEAEYANPLPDAFNSIAMDEQPDSTTLCKICQA